MVRVARVVVPGYPHHVTRRGARRRLWITFWRRFWGVFLGGFWEPTGLGAGFRGFFSADGVVLARWASANFDFFRGFFTFFDRFLPVFGPYFALFSSMSCAYLYVNNFFPASLAWDLHSLHRRARRERRERRELGEKAKRQTAQPSPQRRRGGLGNGERQRGTRNAERGMDGERQAERPVFVFDYAVAGRRKSRMGAGNRLDAGGLGVPQSDPPFLMFSCWW
jgi:hypothetical protein